MKYQLSNWNFLIKMSIVLIWVCYMIIIIGIENFVEGLIFLFGFLLCLYFFTQFERQAMELRGELK